MFFPVDRIWNFELSVFPARLTNYLVVGRSLLTRSIRDLVTTRDRLNSLRHFVYVFILLMILRANRYWEFRVAINPYRGMKMGIFCSVFVSEIVEEKWMTLGSWVTRGTRTFSLDFTSALASVYVLNLRWWVNSNESVYLVVSEWPRNMRKCEKTRWTKEHRWKCRVNIERVKMACTDERMRKTKTPSDCCQKVDNISSRVWTKTKYLSTGRSAMRQSTAHVGARVKVYIRDA